MSKPKNVNKRSPSDKDEQRSSQGGERMKRHGTAKSRARKRNRLRAERERNEQPIQE